MSTKKFIRHQENFICEVCGYSVQGNGYTNHCPKCLISKHVDVYPGDREAKCGGLMDVTDIEMEGDKYIFTHTCRTCGHKKRNKQSPEDSTEAIVAITKQLHK